LSILNGEQRKTKEILRWTRRKQRRHIRTEELYNYLIDRPSYHSVNSTEIVNTTNQTPIVDDLQTFRQALVMDSKKIFLSLFFLFLLNFYLDNENASVSSYDHSEQLESFVRQQVANQLARKRDYHSTDLYTNDWQKSKRTRHT
jgi:hypothetical protein